MNWSHIAALRNLSLGVSAIIVISLLTVPISADRSLGQLAGQPGSQTLGGSQKLAAASQILGRVITEIRNNQIGNGIADLHSADRQLLTAGISPSIQSVRSIVKSSIGALQVGNVAQALAHINQAHALLTTLSTPKAKTATSTAIPVTPSKPRVTATPSSQANTTLSTKLTPPKPLSPVSPSTTTSGPSSSNCVIIPGAAMTFRQVCPNSNTSSAVNNNLISPQQPSSPPTTTVLPKPVAPSPLPTPAVSQTAPIAVTGPSQTVASGVVVTLNGSGSHNPNGNKIVGYTWSESRTGPQVGLTSYKSATPSFMSPSVKIPTKITFFLTVSDGAHESAPVGTVVTVVPKQSNTNTNSNNSNNAATTQLVPGQPNIATPL